MTAVQQQQQQQPQPQPANDVYAVKRIDFFGRSVKIVMQNINGPCPLLAIANGCSPSEQICIRLVEKLTTGIDVNVKFHNVHAFEPTPEVAVFDLLGIPLVHGWLVDPQLLFLALGDEEMEVLAGSSLRALSLTSHHSGQDGAIEQLVEDMLAYVCSDNMPDKIELGDSPTHSGLRTRSAAMVQLPVVEAAAAAGSYP
eukprot:gene7703-7902_t